MLAWPRLDLRVADGGAAGGGGGERGLEVALLGLRSRKNFEEILNREAFASPALRGFVNAIVLCVAQVR